MSLQLTSTSRAADGAYLALADLAAIGSDLSGEYRIVGGHMVTLHVAKQGLADQVPLRETLDADFGAQPQVVGDPELPEALRARGYVVGDAANRFIRQEVDSYGEVDLVIDILAPSYQSGMRPGQQHGALVVDEIPGLAFALARPATVADLRVRLTSGRRVDTTVTLPDLCSALCIKALAYRGRFADKDAVDLWRLLNVAYAAGLRAESWPQTATGRVAAEVLQRFFGQPSGQGLRQVSADRKTQAQMRTMIKELVR